MAETQRVQKATKHLPLFQKQIAHSIPVLKILLFIKNTKFDNIEWNNRKLRINKTSYNPENKNACL